VWRHSMQEEHIISASLTYKELYFQRDTNSESDKWPDDSMKEKNEEANVETGDRLEKENLFDISSFEEEKNEKIFEKILTVNIFESRPITSNEDNMPGKSTIPKGTENISENMSAESKADDFSQNSNFAKVMEKMYDLIFGKATEESSDSEAPAIIENFEIVSFDVAEQDSSERGTYSETEDYFYENDRVVTVMENFKAGARADDVRPSNVAEGLSENTIISSTTNYFFQKLFPGEATDAISENGRNNVLATADPLEPNDVEANFEKDIYDETAFDTERNSHINDDGIEIEDIEEGYNESYEYDTDSCDELCRNRVLSLESCKASLHCPCNMNDNYPGIWTICSILSHFIKYDGWIDIFKAKCNCLYLFENI
ncbi:hypothetical protein L9F63_022383, partial [Diploptera punctata]